MPKKQKYAISDKAVRLLRRVIKHILAEPRRYDQTVFAEHDPESPCGTVGCIAGWAVILDHNPRPSRAFLDSLKFDGTFCKNLRGPGSRVISVKDRARRLLGEKVDSSRLFVGYPNAAGGWPEPFGTRWGKANTRRARARVAADRIEHFIQTGK